ncbi:4-alpha-glucanotransferase [Lysobacter korlensis]|uniref:4-alpha-glucanotransferase n=1 Tax=Lysobacter korlensis TaxID=553636 RepID=A0ABV6RYE3_9GAMM
MTSGSDPLLEIAGSLGVSTSFDDWQGRTVEVPRDAIEDVLAAMGVDPTGLGSGSAVLPHCVVVREGEARVLVARVSPGEQAEVSIELEGGGSRALGAGEQRNAETREVRLALPDDLPLGYHALKGRVGDASIETAIVVTPRWLGLPDAMGEEPSWGFAVQLYSARSRDSWGVGDLGDLGALAEWSAELGADYILINPLHAAEPVAPLQPSPYLPSSRRFFNPLYLRVEDVPEYRQLDAQERAGIDALGDEVREETAGKDIIDRDTAWAAKRAALELLHRVPRTDEREQQYAAFRELHAESLSRFAAWNALAVEYGNDYREWPAELQDAASDDVVSYAVLHESEVDFAMWLQWQLDQQLEDVQRRARQAGMSIGIMHDLAVGVHPGGADAWRLRDAYATGIRVGAPPDAFNQMGQDWQQPPWRPDKLEELAYRPFRDLLANVLRHAGGVRVDHIIGLFRLWWTPEGRAPSDGTYVRYDHEALIGILALEAQRAGAVVVGEDLGVVEPSAREYLAERGVLGTSILWFERDEDGKPLPAEQWRELCLASVTTHDLPPTAGYLAGVHVKLRNDLGLLTRSVEEEAEADRKDRQSWMAELRGRGLLGEDASIEQTVTALHRYLTLAPSRLLNIALTDAVGDVRTQNQPGTLDEYPNWRIPLSGPDERPILLEDVFASERAAALAAAVGTPRRR